MIDKVTITALYRQTDQGEILSTTVDIYDATTGDKVGVLTGKTTSDYVHKLDKICGTIFTEPREENTVIKFK